MKKGAKDEKLNEIRFQYLTEENTKQIEKEMNQAIMIIAFIGILMIANV